MAAIFFMQCVINSKSQVLTWQYKKEWLRLDRVTYAAFCCQGCSDVCWEWLPDSISCSGRTVSSWHLRDARQYAISRQANPTCTYSTSCCIPDMDTSGMVVSCDLSISLKSWSACWMASSGSGKRVTAQSGWQGGCKLLCTSGQGHRWKHGLCSLWGHCLRLLI